jgi:hypothetical protein
VQVIDPSCVTQVMPQALTTEVAVASGHRTDQPWRAWSLVSVTSAT